jgi:hypothetical protein
MATAANNLASDGHCFFEGTEKLLEVWFTNPNDKGADLRVIDRFVSKCLSFFILVVTDSKVI